MSLPKLCIFTFGLQNFCRLELCRQADNLQDLIDNKSSKEKYIDGK